nr:PREDICTED: ankyrin repeat and SOCS box protein 18 [Struthio camelus australis]
MAELPGPVTEKLQISPKLEHPLTAHAPANRYYAALVTGDFQSLKVLTDRYYEDVNLVFEISQDELEWRGRSRASYGLSGLWSLEYKRELSTPLCIAAGRAGGWRVKPAMQGAGRHGTPTAELGALEYGDFRELRPYLCVQVLLNHGSQKIWPSAFMKVLKSCAAVPEIIEMLFNSYSQIAVSETWAEAIPEEVFQQHLTFYESLFRLSGTARCLQHLCRFAIRKKFGSKCHCLIPLLPVPKPLRDYLLLEPEGAVF